MHKATVIVCLLIVMYSGFTLIYSYPSSSPTQRSSDSSTEKQSLEQDILHLNSGFPHQSSIDSMDEFLYNDPWVQHRHYAVVIDAGR